MNKSARHRIRETILGDRQELALLYRECRMEADWLPTDLRAQADYDRDTKGETVFISRDDEGRIEGFVSIWEPDSFVHHLYVRKDRRGAGIGAALLNVLAERYQPPWQLKCNAKNTRALHFYRRLGWQMVGSGESEEGGYLLLERT